MFFIPYKGLNEVPDGLRVGMYETQTYLYTENSRDFDET